MVFKPYLNLSFSIEPKANPEHTSMWPLSSFFQKSKRTYLYANENIHKIYMFDFIKSEYLKTFCWHSFLTNLGRYKLQLPFYTRSRLSWLPGQLLFLIISVTRIFHNALLKTNCVQPHKPHWTLHVEIENEVQVFISLCFQ